MNKNELIVLGLLNEGPAYGYQLKNIIQERGLDKWGIIKQPSIYSTLNKLEKEEKITGKKEQHGNMPPSTIYSLTEKGKRVLKQNVEEALTSRKIPVNPAILGIAFITGTSKQSALKILRENLEFIEKQSKAFLKVKSDAEKKNIGFNRQFILDFGNDIRPIVKKRLEELIKKIEETDESFFYQEKEGDAE